MVTMKSFTECFFRYTYVYDIIEKKKVLWSCHKLSLCLGPEPNVYSKLCHINGEDIKFIQFMCELYFDCLLFFGLHLLNHTI